MPRGTGAPKVDLTDAERDELERWRRRRKSSYALGQRAWAILLAAGGETNVAIAKSVGVTRATVGRWRTRFVEERCDGLLDERRPGAPRTAGAPRPPPS